jgi:superfamily I DNA/RNA helicase
VKRKAAALLEGLNEPQRRAVTTTEGPVLVLAGAGSGKTRVITQRIAWIIAQKLAKPGEILAVTFTNKAAAEMQDRAAALIGPALAGDIIIATFHSFCLRVLRRHIEHLGYRRNFTIASDSDSRDLMRRVVDTLGTADSWKPASFQAAVSIMKNSGDPDAAALPEAETETDRKYRERMQEVFERYQSALRAANSLDFDDLLLLTQELWREHPRLLDRFRKRFRYILVDEYQDTNRVQFDLLRMLADGHGNLCVVGDDDQSIYAWRGADTKNILEFDRAFAGARIITLEQNYRSTESILAAANGVIANNTARREKKLWSALGKGRPLDHFVVGDEEEEAKEAARWLRHIQEKTGARWRDFALLYRSKQQSRAIEVAFRQAGIPYVVFGGQEFFERAEVKDIIAYLKVMANPRDETAFLRIVNMPRRGIGDAALHQAHTLCCEENLTLANALSAMLKRGMVNTRVERNLREFIGLLNHFRKRFRQPDTALRRITEEMAAAIDYHGELQRVCRKPELAFNRWQNVEAVLQAVEEYEKNAAAPTLTGFLDESHLNSDQDRAGRDERIGKSVSLMTIHSAKGLEFPYVFLMGCEEGLIPHERSIREGSLEEERRLFYVALTRGRRHVTLFEALSRKKHGREYLCKPSRFLGEIPEALLNRRIRAAREMVAARAAPDAGRKIRKKKRRRRKKQA